MQSTEADTRAWGPIYLEMNAMEKLHIAREGRNVEETVTTTSEDSKTSFKTAPLVLSFLTRALLIADTSASIPTSPGALVDYVCEPFFQREALLLSPCMTGGLIAFCLHVLPVVL